MSADAKLKMTIKLKEMKISNLSNMFLRKCYCHALKPLKCVEGKRCIVNEDCGSHERMGVCKYISTTRSIPGTDI